MKPRFAIAFAIACLLVNAAFAHDPHRPDLDGWFGKLQSYGKALCCSGSDAEAVADPDWESSDGHYRVRIDGQWIAVPDNAVVTEPNLFGRTMVWPMRYPGAVIIRCFMPGAMG